MLAYEIKLRKMTAERNFQKSNCCFYGKIQKIEKNCHNPKKGVAGIWNKP
jgi:hypothetical protein